MSGEKQIVWVTEYGVYSERGIGGVYATVEAAIAANPISESAQKRWPDAKWKQIGPLAWDNGCDWASACSIEGYEVIGA